MPIAIKQFQPKTDNFFTRYLERIAHTKLPRRWKRLIYVSSILGLIQQVKDPDMRLVNKLNKVLRIADNSNSYILPMYIKSIIWKQAANHSIVLGDRSISVEEIGACDLTRTDCTAIGVYFANNAPAWLKYGSDELMVSDVKLLINQINQSKQQF